MATQKRDKNGRFVSTKDNVNAATWFKNAAKSLGYSGIDLLKETMPAVIGTIDTNKEWAIDLVSSIRKSSRNSRLNNLGDTLTGKKLEIYNDINTIKNNAISDLKTGKFYNKERKPTAEFGIDDFDDDFSFSMSDDLDDSNFNEEESGETTVVRPVINITSNINSDNPMVQAVRQQSKYIEQSEQSAAKRDVLLANAQMGLDKKIAETLYGGMETINSNLSTLIGFNNEQVGGYIGASLRYYEDNINLMSQINDNLKNLQATVSESYKYGENPAESIFEGTGAFNISNYMNLVKKQFNNAIDETLLGTVRSMIMDSEGLAAVAQSPLNFISKFMLSKVIPDFLTMSLKSFDNSFKSFIPALLNKMGSWSDEYEDGPLGIIKQVVGKIFGIDNAGKTSIDLANYEKGRVPFDGITRKSIVEVIPGYLSKILSALTGKEEIIFDSQEGKFVTKSKARENYDRTIRSSALFEFDALTDIKSKVNAFIEDRDDVAKVQNDIDNLFVELSKRKKSFNPRTYTTKSGLTQDDLSELLPATVGGNEKEMIRQIILSLPKSEQIKLFGRDHIASRRSVTETLEKMEETGNSAVLSLFNGLYDDNKDSAGKSVFESTDRFGKTNLDYLRDLRTILLEGINVKIVNKINRRKNYSNEIDYSAAADTTPSARRELTDEEILRNSERGVNRYNTLEQVPSDPDELRSTIDTYDSIQNDTRTNSQKNKNPIDRIIRFLFSSSDRTEMISGFFKNIRDGAANILDGFVKGVDNTMYKIIFGSDGDDENVGFFEKIKASISGFFFGKEDENGKKNGGFFTYLRTKFFDPIKEAFIGEDGIITKFKESDFYKGLKEKGRKALDYIIGTPDDTGKRSGGLFSGVANSFKDMSDNMKLYFTGTLKDKDGNIIKSSDKSVFGEIKGIFKSFTGNIKEYLVGSDNGETAKNNAKGLLNDLGGYFKEGFQSFIDAIFGQNPDAVDKKIRFNDVTEKIKERAPKSIAGGIIGGGLGLLAGAGGFGILGSLFLGPMSGVVIGTATAFLSQSEKFKNYLFGEKDDNGERLGGLISKSTQKFFSDNKGGLLLGAGLGALKGITGIGILPSFILGGPITGALFGLASSLLIKSNMFQNMLFGEKLDDGTRSGGILGKVTGKLNNDADLKRKLGFAGAGLSLGAIGGTALSSFGILGGIAFGPLTGAILGAGAGIALAANKWKDAIFGKFDKDGNKTENGILSKMMAAVTVNVLQPAKIAVTEWSYNIQDWFEEKIAEPIIDSMAPIKEEISRMKDRITEFASSVLEKLHIPELVDGAKTFIGDFVKTSANAIKFVAGKAASGIVSITKTILQAPASLVHFIADKILLPKHMREGIREVRAQIIENIKNSDFVKNIVTPVVDTVKDGVTAVKDFTFKAIKGTFKFFGKALLATLKGITKIAAGIIAAPFKLGIGLVKGTVDVVKGIGRLLTGNKDRDNDRLNNIASGDRGFLQSIGDLASLALPGSSLRNSAKFSEAGANYQDARVEAREQRAAERNARKIAHEEIINSLKAKNALNKEQAKALNYNLLTDEQKKLLTFDEFNKLIDGDRELRKEKRKVHKAAVSELKTQLQGKESIDYESLTDEQKAEISKSEFNQLQDKTLKKKYGKEYSKMSKMQKDAFTETKVANNAIVDTQKNTKTAADTLKDIFTKGIFIRGKKSDNETNKPTIETPKTAASVAEDAGIVSNNSGIDTTGLTVSANTEEKSDQLKYETHGKTHFEAIEEERAEEEKEKQKNVFERIAGLLSKGNEDRKEQSNAWASIFSKNGLITGGLLLLSPFIINFFKEIGPKLISALGVGFGDAADDYAWTEQNAGRTNGNTMTEEFNKTVQDFKDGNILTDETGDTNTRTDSILNFAARRGLNIANSRYVNPLSSNINKVEKGIYTGIKDAGGFTKNVITKMTGGPKYSAAQVADAFGTTTDDIVESLGNKKRYSTKQIAKFMGSSTDEVAGLMDDAAKAGGKVAETLKVKPKGDKKLLTKITGYVNQFFDDIAKKFTAKTGKTGFKWVGKISPKNIVKALSSSWDNIATKVATKLGIKGGAAAVTAGVSELIFATIGVVNGVSGTAKLFQVSNDKVDGTMRLIAGIFGALAGTTVGSIIDLVFSLISPVVGFDILSSMAVAMYNFIAGDDKSEKLASAQDAFKEAYINDRDKTLEEQYQTQLKSGIIDENVTFEQFKQGVDNGTYSASYKSFADWNVEQNKSLGDKLGSAIGTGIKGIGKGLSAAGKFLFGSKTASYQDSNGNTYTKNPDGTYQVKSSSGKDLGFINEDAIPKDATKITEKRDGIFVKAGKGIGKAAVAVKDKVTDLVQPVTEFIKPYFNMGKELLTYVKDVVVTGVSSAITGNADNDKVSISEDDPLSGIKKILYYGGRALTLPVYIPLKVGKFVWDKVVKPIGDGILNVGKGFFSVNLLDALKGNGIFSSEYWTAPEDESNPMGILGKIGFYAQRVMTAPQGLVLSVGKLAWDKVVKPIGQGVLNAGKGFFSVNLLDALKGNGIFSSEYWTAPEDESNPMGVLGKIGFYAQRVMTAPQGLVLSVGKLAWDKVIKPIGQGVLQIGKGFISTTPLDALKGNGIFSSEYWTAPEDESNPMGVLGKIGFYAQRVMTLPQGLVLSVGKLAANALSSLWNGAKNIGKSITNALNTTKETTKTYWDFKPTDNSILGSFEKVVFYIGRGLMAPSFYLRQALTSVADKLKEGFKWVLDVLGIDDLFVDPTKSNKNAGGPIGGPISSNYKVTSDYNETDNQNIRNGKKHNGIDLTKFNNAPIESFTDGTVVTATDQYTPNSGGIGNTDGGGYGNHVFIRDNNGYYHRYGHLNQVDVQNGQKVSKGTILGLQGNTGNSTGSHLHYEVRKPDNTTNVDPNKFIGGPIGNASQLQQALVDKMLSIYGDLNYSLDWDKQDPDKGVASCASTVAWAYDKVLGFKPGGSGFASSTSQSKDDRFTTIYENKGNNPIDLSILQPGDILYQNWNRTSNNGDMDHTEMYGGIYDGQPSTLSHGKAPGPNWRYMNQYRRDHTMMVRRYNDFMGSTTGSNSYDESNFVIGSNVNAGINDTTTPTNTSGGLAGVVSSISSALSTLFKPLTDLTSQITSNFNALINGTDPASNIDGSVVNTVTTGSNLAGNDTDEKIWNYFKSKGLPSQAIAGLMGNLFYESALKTNNVENWYNKESGLSDEEFTAKVDNNSISKSQFLSNNRKYGYGLAQWTWPSRKEGLYNLVKGRNTSISDIGAQLDFLDSELNGNFKSSVLNPIKKSNTVRDASTIVLKKFEAPANQGPSVVNQRANKSQEYYNKFANGMGGPIDEGTTQKTTIQERPMFKTANYNNTLRNTLQEAMSSSKNTDEKVYEFLSKIVDALVSIKDNTKSTTDKIDELKTVESNRTSNVAVIDNSKKQSSSAMYDIASNRKAEKINKGYTTAKLIASGAQ